MRYEELSELWRLRAEVARFAVIIRTQIDDVAQLMAQRADLAAKLDAANAELHELRIKCGMTKQ